MRKGQHGAALVIILTVAIIALVGLVWVFLSGAESPTGQFGRGKLLQVGTGSIPLALTGIITDCGVCDKQVIFEREDGKKFRGRSRDMNGVCNYQAKVRNFEDVPTIYDVTFKSGLFIDQVEIPIPTSNEGILDLSCAPPTPVPTTPPPTPVPTTPPPTEEPTPVPTTPPPTEEPTPDPTGTIF